MSVHMLAAKIATTIVETKPIEYMDEFEDDHILCATVKIGDDHVDFYCIGWEGLAAFKYMNDSPSAKKTVFEMIRYQVQTTAENLLDFYAAQANDPDLTAEDVGVVSAMNAYGLATASVVTLEEIVSETYKD